MKIHDIITESVSSILYHATSFHGASQLLETDFMKGPEVSFTRSLQGAYHTSNKLIGVIFQFDGNKLNHNYKGGPVGTENFLYDPDDYDPDDKDTWEFTGRDNGQLEDRVYAKDGIKNATNYITEAIIYAPIEYVKNSSYDEFEDRTYSEQLQSTIYVLRQLEANNIPYRYVATEKDLAGNKNDRDGFVKVIKYMYSELPDTSSDKKFSSDLKTEYDVGQTWILDFADYSNYDPEDDFPDIRRIEKEFKGTRDEAIAYGRKKTHSGDIELTGILDVDSDDHTEL